MTKTIKFVDFMIIGAIITIIISLLIPTLHMDGHEPEHNRFVYGDIVRINGKLGKITGYKVIKTATQNIKIYTVHINGQDIEVEASDIILMKPE